MTEQELYEFEHGIDRMQAHYERQAELDEEITEDTDDASQYIDAETLAAMHAEIAYMRECGCPYE